MLSRPETHGNPVLLIALIVGFLDLQSRFRGRVPPPEDTSEGLLKLQVQLWHVELAPGNTAKSGAIILAGKLTPTARGRRTPGIQQIAERSGSMSHFAQVGATLAILMASGQANKALPGDCRLGVLLRTPLAKVLSLHPSLRAALDGSSLSSPTKATGP